MHMYSQTYYYFIIVLFFFSGATLKWRAYVAFVILYCTFNVRGKDNGPTTWLQDGF